MPIRDLGKYVSPSLTADTIGKTGFSYAGQLGKNLTSISRTKLYRLEHAIRTIFTKREWINNQSVMFKLEKKFSNLANELISGANKGVVDFADTNRIRSEIEEMKAVCEVLRKGGGDLKEARAQKLVVGLNGLEEAVHDVDEIIMERKNRPYEVVKKEHEVANTAYELAEDGFTEMLTKTVSVLERTKIINQSEKEELLALLEQTKYEESLQVLKTIVQEKFPAGIPKHILEVLSRVDTRLTAFLEAEEKQKNLSFELDNHVEAPKIIKTEQVIPSRPYDLVRQEHAAALKEFKKAENNFRGLLAVTANAFAGKSEEGESIPLFSRDALNVTRDLIDQNQYETSFEVLKTIVKKRYPDRIPSDIQARLAKVEKHLNLFLAAEAAEQKLDRELTSLR